MFEIFLESSSLLSPEHPLNLLFQLAEEKEEARTEDQKEKEHLRYAQKYLRRAIGLSESGCALRVPNRRVFHQGGSLQRGREEVGINDIDSHKLILKIFSLRERWICHLILFRKP